ncbi:MAG TPA: hypothetical protein VGI39_32130 [Polyangiaceae bacterium]|jgi:pimeloyl-ACP methyl ester carboxylesterase
MLLSRRALGLVPLAFAFPFPRVPVAELEPLELRLLPLEHPTLLALPRAVEHPVPLVVLLHGLGETGAPLLGARAWVDRYGLATSVARLQNPPLAQESLRNDWGNALAEANALLAARPYRGLAFACPHVPYMPVGQLDAYTRWIADSLIPRVRAEAGPALDGALPRLAGCSYGGWASLEVLLRAPDRFSAWAGIQTALSIPSARAYGERLARLSPRPLLVQTSLLDPFHDPSLILASGLRTRKVACDLRVLPGPHDQPWLREAGTPMALLWLDCL